VPKPIDLAGQRFGNLTVIARNGILAGKAAWRCACDCGATTTVASCHLRSGATRSCGCRRSAANVERNFRHGLSADPAYAHYRNMMERCSGKQSHVYVDKGIAVCQEWADSVEAFVKWAHSNGYTPGLTLDRRDNAKGYEPDNCRWVDRWTQANNRDDNIVHDGKTVAEWCRETGVNPVTAYQRIKRGVPIDIAITAPATPRNKRRAGMLISP